MMKRSIELAEQVGVQLEGVLTWAFTFPGSQYFAGYRALSTNGVHLPVLNAFKLLAQLRGERLSASSTGAIPLSELLDTSAREQADIDVLAALDDDVIRAVVWNYHDDLVDVEPAQVTVTINVPEGFGDRVMVSHQRVDEQHGDAFSVWKSQGRPATPSDEELRALRSAMNALEYSPSENKTVENGTVSLSFELPRHGVSLLTLTPATESGEGSDTEKAGCSCRIGNQKRRSFPTFVMLLLSVALTRKLRPARPGRIAQGRAPRPELH
jgi:xylan 1,4-beta-xylosidase